MNPTVETFAPSGATAPLLGMLEVVDRHGVTTARLPVHQWPVTVGRAMTADLVLDDPHIAAQHLHIDVAPDGGASVTVQDTINGVRHGATLHRRTATFGWNGTDDLQLGRLRLRLRLPAMPLAPELALPDAPWGGVPLTVVLMLAVVGLSVFQAWLKAGDTAQFAQTAVTLVGLVLFVLNVWVGIWALATKLFTGHMQFWRHMRIVCAFSLLETVVSGGGYVLAFVFSWESLAQFNFLLSAPVITAGLYAQLLVIAPQRRRGLLFLTTSLMVLALLATMGNTWLQSKRATSQIYMGVLLPPSWRLAPAVSVEQFMHEAQSIGPRLDKRLMENDDAGMDTQSEGDDGGQN